MNILSNAPRHLRSHLHVTLQPHTILGAEEHTLYLLSPKQTSESRWRFAVLYQNQMVLIGKHVKTRDIGRVEALRRYGVKSQEVRGEQMPKVKTPKATKVKPSIEDQLATALKGDAA
jgi:hypothetical protein